MFLTATPCPHCGYRLYRPDETTDRHVCPNTHCPEKFDDCCPFCQSADKTVRVVRLGSAGFTCNTCGEAWDRSSGGMTSTGNKVVVVNFRRLPKAS